MQEVVYVFALFGAFLLGGMFFWMAKDYIEAFIDNAAYAKAITHPEMLDENGKVNQEELLYLRFTDDDGMIDDEDDD